MIYHHIMVAVDRSNASNLALLEAIRSTKDQQAKLRIIYVIEEAVVKTADGRVDFDILWNAYKEEAQDILKIINKQVKESLNYALNPTALHLINNRRMQYFEY